MSIKTTWFVSRLWPKCNRLLRLRRLKAQLVCPDGVSDDTCECGVPAFYRLLRPWSLWGKFPRQNRKSNPVHMVSFHKFWPPNHEVGLLEMYSILFILYTDPTELLLLYPSAQRCLPRFFTGVLIFKGLTVRRLYTSFGVKGLTLSLPN
jgi:hypothetical protein